jgi:hypothetical protein
MDGKIVLVTIYNIKRMKNLRHTIKSLTGLLIFMLGASLLTSCLKKSDSDPLPNAALTLINASAATDSLNLYFDGYLVNANPVRYKNKVDYFQFYPGNHSLVVTKSKSNAQIAGGYGGFNAGEYYTLFVIASSADSTKLILKNDSVTNPAAGKAKIRFANLTYDAPQVNIGIEGKEGSLFTQTPFRKITTFVEIDPGTYTFKIQPTADAATDKLVQPNVKIEADKVYTIWTRGLWNGSTASNEFGIELTGY